MIETIIELTKNPSEITLIMLTIIILFAIISLVLKKISMPIFQR
jgi:hypothetical protein